MPDEQSYLLIDRTPERHRSADRALTNFHEVISLWVDAAKEFGKTIPEPKGRRLQ
jgi:hypothetical protein